MKYHHIFFLFLFLSIPGLLPGQYYETGQDPSSLRWVQINTGHFRVIYPESYGLNGQVFARSLDRSLKSLGTLFPETRGKIPVVIHPYTTMSNGYVAWAPKRMELYPTPEQNTIPLDPFTQLSVHETTHVLQMEALGKGFTKGLSWVFGEQAYGMSAFFLPLWFLEGDAVFAETALTGSGRGRSAAFAKQLKAFAIDKPGFFKYDQLVSGSYRDFIPDHYQTGYQMVAWTMAHYDRQTWNRTLDFTGRYPFSINPVNISLARNTGLSKKTLFRETFDTLRTNWKRELALSGAMEYPAVNPVKKGAYINYYSPVDAGADSIIAVRTSLDRTPAFVLIRPSSKSARTIYVPGQIWPYVITYGGGKLVWVELRDDPRWANRQYSVIRVMDLRSGMVRTLSGRTRYLSAAVSRDGKTIAATENTPDNRNSLVFLDAVTGELIRSVPSEGSAYLQRPQWSADNRLISMISLTEKGEGVLVFDTHDLVWKTFIEPGNTDLQSSVIRNDSLFFVSSVSGTENVYARAAGGTVSALTNARFGITDIEISGSRLLFTDYSSEGSAVCSAMPGARSPLHEPVAYPASWLINRSGLEAPAAVSLPDTVYTVRPYHKWQHPFRFHSWMPFYADIEKVRTDPASVRPGVTLMTQNTLSTLVSTLGYEYSADRQHLFHSRVTWQGWYPVLESQIDYGLSPSVAKQGEEVDDPSPLRKGAVISNTLSVPLSFSSGRFYQYLRISASSSYHNSYVYMKEAGNYDYGQNLLSGRIYFSNYHRYAYRDLYPRWAQTIDVNYSFAPFDRDIYGTEFSVRTAFYFPGILRSHGIRIRLEKEKQAPVKYLFTSKIALPRGYENIISRDIGLAAADYALPLLYPDLNIGSLFYLKRVRTALFCDLARGTGNTYYHETDGGLKPVFFRDYTETFASAGFELMTDFHLFRIPYMISGGVQAAWTKEGKGPVFRALFNMDMFGLAIGRNRH